MGTGLDLIVAALLGLLVGAVASVAFAVSERERRAERPDATPGISPDEAALLAAYPEIAVLLGPEGEVVRASPSALHFGLVRAGSIAHEEIRAMVARLRARHEAQSAELALRRGPTGQANLLYVKVSVAPLTRGRVLVLAQDQTAARRLDQTRRDFVANVSHELKTPVGAIGLLAETVEDSADEPEVVARFAAQMKREARRLATLVQEIIDLSRLQEPDALVDPELVGVDGVVAEALDRVAVTATSRNVNMVVGGTSGLQVFGDEQLLVTAVRNLLDNAIRYSEPGHPVSVGVSRRDGMVRIAVVDQGIGIEEDAQERVFERFYRVDAARSRQTGGTGLGLSIVKHIAADHGGEVTVWSKEGRGSTFTLILPEATTPTELEEEL